MIVAMRKMPLTNDAAAKLLCRLSSGKTLNEGEKLLLDSWMKASYYNKSVVDDITSDDLLRARLIEAGTNDATFWTVLLTYRAALHSGMPRRVGNFWSRVVKVGRRERL